MTARVAQDAHQDPLVEKYLAARDFVVRRRTPLLAAGGAVIVLVLATIFVMHSRARADRELRTQLAEATLLMQAMDFPRAALQLESLLDRHPGGEIGQEIRHHAATAVYLTGNFNRARELFQYTVDHGPKNSARVLAAREGLANCEESLGSPEQAAGMYEALAADVKNNDKKAMLLTDAARCYQLAGKPGEVRRLADRLVAEYGKDNPYWKREGARLAARSETETRFGVEPQASSGVSLVPGAAPQ